MPIFPQELKDRLAFSEHKNATIILERMQLIEDLVSGGLTLDPRQYKRDFISACSDLHEFTKKINAGQDERFLKSKTEVSIILEGIGVRHKAALYPDQTNDVVAFEIKNFITQLYLKNQINKKFFVELIGKLTLLKSAQNQLVWYLNTLRLLKDIFTMDNSENFSFLFKNFSMESIFACIDFLKIRIVFLAKSYDLLNEHSMQAVIAQARLRQGELNRSLFPLVEELRAEYQGHVNLAERRKVEESKNDGLEPGTPKYPKVTDDAHPSPEVDEEGMINTSPSPSF